jgi:hypothetical protein
LVQIPKCGHKPFNPLIPTAIGSLFKTEQAIKLSGHFIDLVRASVAKPHHPE